MFFNGLSNPLISTTKNNTHPEGWVLFLAEKEGFEPSIPFWGIHDFQSCALGQLRDFSISSSALGDLHIILLTSGFVNRYFENF